MQGTQVPSLAHSACRHTLKKQYFLATFLQVWIDTLVAGSTDFTTNHSLLSYKPSIFFKNMEDLHGTMDNKKNIITFRTTENSNYLPITSCYIYPLSHTTDYCSPLAEIVTPLANKHWKCWQSFLPLIPLPTISVFQPCYSTFLTTLLLITYASEPCREEGHATNIPGANRCQRYFFRSFWFRFIVMMDKVSVTHV